MKIAKGLDGANKGKWFVQDGVRGWIDSEGNVTVVHASQKSTKFYKDLPSAKADGFSPGSVHQRIIDSWQSAPKAAAPVVSPKSDAAPAK